MYNLHFATDARLSMLSAIERAQKERAMGICTTLMTGCYDLGTIAQIMFTKEGRYQVESYAGRREVTFYLGVDPDQTVEANKGDERPIYKQWERVFKMSLLPWIDVAFAIYHPGRMDYTHFIGDPFVHPWYIEMLKAFNPEVLVLNWSESYYRLLRNAAWDLGIHVSAVDPVKGYSTTDILSILRREQLRAAE